MKYIDLSHDIKNGMPIYPGDTEVKISKENDYEKDGYNLYSIYTSMHVGTHIDAPLHMVKGNKNISEYSVDRFMGNAVLLDVRGQKEIKIKDEYYRLIKENDIVLLFTGWDKLYGKEEYYISHPIVSEELAELLIKKKIKMIGIDMPSVDKNNFNIHKKLFENDIFILENLTNLNELLYAEDLLIFAQPLKFEGEASLVRAVAGYRGY